jgi:rhodanese-related sulfurtransferase
MKTIHPLKLEALLEASQPVEIVDIRPRAEFEKVHIEGAHSIPSAEISPETLVCTRELLQTEPLYLVSESGALAQLQACDLERQGLDNVVVVSGGKCDEPRVFAACSKRAPAYGQNDYPRSKPAREALRLKGKLNRDHDG